MFLSTQNFLYNSFDYLGQNLTEGLNLFSKSFKRLEGVPEKIFNDSSKLTTFAEAFVADIKVFSLLTGRAAPSLLISNIERFADFVFAASAPSVLIQDLCKKHVLFSIPRFQKNDCLHKAGEVDWSGFFMKLADVCWSLEYLKTCDFVELSDASKLAAQVGATKVVNFEGNTLLLGDFPIIELLLRSPSLFFYLIGSGIAVKNWLKKTYLETEKVNIHTFFNADFFQNQLPAINRCLAFGLKPYFGAANHWFLLIHFLTKNLQCIVFIIQVEKAREAQKKERI